MTAKKGAQQVIGQIISIFFHPLFIPGYITAFLLYLHPFAFAGYSDWGKTTKLISVVLLTAFFPAFTVLLLKLLGFADSIQLKSQKDRIIPIVACMIYYFWIFYVNKNLPDNPPELIAMLCAVFISSIIALTANNFLKISLHTIATGILAAFFIYLSWTSFIPMALPLSVALLVAGLVGTARLMVSDHSMQELWWGYFTGIISMALAIVLVG